VGEEIRVRYPNPLEKNKDIFLVLQQDGNLVLYRGFNDPGQALWSSVTSGRNSHSAEMQQDGNFVLYDQESKPIWASDTKDNNGAFLAVQGDGNMVIYKKDAAEYTWKTAIWSTHTYS
jgi:hypothetical protein